jgi:hypothetical protein
MANRKAPEIPFYAAPGFFFETVKDGEVVESKFQSIRKAMESIEAWPAYEQHTGSIRLGRYN